MCNKPRRHWRCRACEKRLPQKTAALAPERQQLRMVPELPTATVSMFHCMQISGEGPRPMQQMRRRTKCMASRRAIGDANTSPIGLLQMTAALPRALAVANGITSNSCQLRRHKECTASRCAIGDASHNQAGLLQMTAALPRALAAANGTTTTSRDHLHKLPAGLRIRCLKKL